MSIPEHAAEPPHTGPPPLVVDVGTPAAHKASVLGVSAALVGVVATATAVTEAPSSGPLGLVLAWTIALLFLGVAIVVLLNRRQVARPRRLILEGAGVRWDDPHGTPWAIRWDELSGLRIARIHIPGRRRLLTNNTTYLDLFPGDAWFRDRHPELEHLWQFRLLRGGYRLSLGSPRDAADLDGWLRRFQPALRSEVHVEDHRQLRILARWGDPTGSGGWLTTPEARRGRPVHQHGGAGPPR